jgi:CBS domain-containing protein
VLEPDGAASVSGTVYCHLNERSTCLTECEQCAGFGGFHVNRAARQTSVRCVAPDVLEALADLDEKRLAAARSDPGRRVVDTRTRIADVMTHAALCVRADTPVEELAKLIERESLSLVPVVDGVGRAVGVVSNNDVPRGLRSGAVTARQIMTPVVFALNASLSVDRAAALMAFEGVPCVVAIGDGGQVVGILWALDVLRWIGQSSGYVIPPATRATG